MEEKLIQKTILVADDDSDVVFSISQCLASKGFQVRTAVDGNQAIAIAETVPLDLIVLDVMMPKRSGFLVLEHLREKTDVDCPVVVITGLAGRRHMDYLNLLGIAEILHKPFSIDKLVECIETVLTHPSRRLKGAKREAPRTCEKWFSEVRNQSGLKPNKDVA